MSLRRDEGGFTLVELLTAMTLMLVVLGATLETFNRFERTNQRTVRQNEAQDLLRASTDRIARELRNAAAAPGSGATAPAALERATAYDVVFQRVNPNGASAGNATGLQRVRYCLEATTGASARLWRQTQSAPGSVLPDAANCPGPIIPGAAGWNDQTVAVDRVTNRSDGKDRAVFDFGANAGSLPDINAVRTDLFTREAGIEGRERQLTSAIALRNGNRRPSADFTVSVVNGTVNLDASGSDDPEGQALIYEWSLDGSVIAGQTEARFDYPDLHGSHSFGLKVTDAGGLTATATPRPVSLP